MPPAGVLLMILLSQPPLHMREHPMVFTVISMGGSIHRIEAASVDEACKVIAKSHNWQVTHVIAGEFAFERGRYQHDGLHQFWRLTPKAVAEPKAALVNLALPARQLIDEPISIAPFASASHLNG